MSGNGISWAIFKSAPCSKQITTPAPQHSVFTGRMPFLLPNQQHQSTKANCDLNSSTDIHISTYKLQIRWLYFMFLSVGMPTFITECNNGKIWHTYFHESVSDDGSFFLGVSCLAQHFRLDLASHRRSKPVDGFHFHHRRRTVERVRRMNSCNKQQHISCLTGIEQCNNNNRSMGAACQNSFTVLTPCRLQLPHSY